MMVLSSNPSNAIDAQMFVPVERLKALVNIVFDRFKKS